MSLLRRAPIAVLALLILPGLGTADPIRAPPPTQALVEGHTVFATIDAHQAIDPFSSSSVVAARASAPDPTLATAEVALRIRRDAGVLWFNDQYLVEPSTTFTEKLGPNHTVESRFGASLAVLVRADDGRGIREPCGGAVMVVNVGDPDPRGYAMAAVDGEDAVAGGSADKAWVGVDSRGPEAYSDGIASATFGSVLGDSGIFAYDYVESYRIADPNDRVWVVDKYQAMARIGLAGGTSVPYTFPVWVVNMHGNEVFVPDVEEIARAPGRDCSGVARVDASTTPADLCGSDLPGILPSRGVDAPCMQYQEPSYNGYCYAGPMVGDADLDGNPDCETPARRYHALVHLRWEDLRYPSASVDHSMPQSDFATSGCESGTEWPCPGEHAWTGDRGDDDAEGNSHAFHPNGPPHAEGQPCPLAAENPTNHGGSARPYAVCDYLHATARVDIYYSGAARPAPPAVRNYAIFDTIGSGASFHDFHAAYGWG